MLPIDPEEIALKDCLQPGRMLLVDTVQGRLVDDAELKRQVAVRNEYSKWLDENQFSMRDVVSWHDSKSRKGAPLDSTDIANDPRLKTFGYTLEHVNMIIQPMVRRRKKKRRIFFKSRL